VTPLPNESIISRHGPNLAREEVTQSKHQSGPSETYENNSPDIFSNISAISENNSSDILGNNQVIHGDLEKLVSLKMKNFKNPCIAYLNIN